MCTTHLNGCWQKLWFATPVCLNLSLHDNMIGDWIIWGRVGITICLVFLSFSFRRIEKNSEAYKYEPLFLEMEQERILAAMVFLKNRKIQLHQHKWAFSEIQIRKPTISKGMSTNLVSFLFSSTWICMPEGKAPTDSLNSYLNVHRCCEWSMKMQFNFMWLKLIM